MSKEQIEEILKEITNLDKLKELFKENSKVIFGNQEDIDTLENDFRKAIQLTETDCCNKLLKAFNIESVPSNVDTFEKVLIYIKSQIGNNK